MAAPASSIKAVLVALSGNLLVTLIKFMAFFLSGSGAMLSESIHSAADTGNQVLLFLGLKRASRERDEEFHYGYGGERFIFGMLSAAGIFFVGCGVTVYHGLTSLLHPHQPEIGPVTFVVLGVSSFLIEGGVLLYAVRAALQQAGGMGFFRYVREKADPATVAVLLEDGAAVLGLLLATAGIVLSYFTGNALFDSMASVIVGLLLGLIAIYLVAENRDLLLGRAVPDEVEQRFVDLIRARPSIADIHDVKTRQLTPESFTFKAEIRLHVGFVAERVQRLLPPGLAMPSGKPRGRLLEEVARNAIQAVSDEIDAIELAVQAAIPEARHIDLEIDHTPITSQAAAPVSEEPQGTGP